MTHSGPKDVAAAYEAFLPANQKILYGIRSLILEVAKENSVIGEITETLKWGEPAYLTEQTKSGSTLRLSQTRVGQKPAVFVNCRTNLIEQFKQHYGDLFNYDGSRAILLDCTTAAHADALRHCISLALTYHSRK